MTSIFRRAVCAGLVTAGLALPATSPSATSPWAVCTGSAAIASGRRASDATVTFHCLSRTSSTPAETSCALPSRASTT